jgi:hypothetical protein
MRATTRRRGVPRPLSPDELVEILDHLGTAADLAAIEEESPAPVLPVSAALLRDLHEQFLRAVPHEARALYARKLADAERDRGVHAQGSAGGGRGG